MRAQHPADRADVAHLHDVVRGELHPEALLEDDGYVQVRQGVPARDLLGRRFIGEIAGFGGERLGQDRSQLLEAAHRPSVSVRRCGVAAAESAPMQCVSFRVAQSQGGSAPRPRNNNFDSTRQASISDKMNTPGPPNSVDGSIGTAVQIAARERYSSAWYTPENTSNER